MQCTKRRGACTPAIALDESMLSNGASTGGAPGQAASLQHLSSTGSACSCQLAMVCICTAQQCVFALVHDWRLARNVVGSYHSGDSWAQLHDAHARTLEAISNVRRTVLLKLIVSDVPDDGFLPESFSTAVLEASDVMPQFK